MPAGDLPRLDDVPIAVTGTGRGIGRALARALGSAGAAVLAHARRAADARAAAEEAREAGARAVVAVAGELGDPSLGARLAAAAEAELGGLDALVLSAAALGPMQPLAALDPGDFAAVMRTNVDDQFRLFRGALPLLERARRGRGTVLWLTSGLGQFALPGYGPYCASKHALEGLMKTVAVEHADRLISLAVGPGMVQTDMLRAALGTDDVSEHRRPADVAAAFVRLLAGIDPALNGQSVEIDRWLA
ncbi:MAG: SDR family oxidoreductase [Planctomycetota bacterium]